MRILGKSIVLFFSLSALTKVLCDASSSIPKLEASPKVLKKSSPWLFLFCSVSPLMQKSLLKISILHKQNNEKETNFATVTKDFTTESKNKMVDIKGAMDERRGGYLMARIYKPKSQGKGTYRCVSDVKIDKLTTLKEFSQEQKVEYHKYSPLYFSEIDNGIKFQNYIFGEIINFNFKMHSIDKHYDELSTKAKSKEVQKQTARLKEMNNKTEHLFKITGAKHFDYLTNKSVSPEIACFRSQVTIFRRLSQTVNFTREYGDYEVGFGNPNGSFWLGLRKIHELTTFPSKLNISMIHENGTTVKLSYGIFSVGDFKSGYKLTVGHYSGDPKFDQLTYHNNQKFSAIDKDQDADSTRKCADIFKGGWWYKDCLRVNPTGPYGIRKGFFWSNFTSNDQRLKFLQFTIVRY